MDHSGFGFHPGNFTDHSLDQGKLLAGLEEVPVRVSGAGT